MPENSVETKSPFAATTESLLKLGSVALGIVYVFGLLVSNVQLMELGISDFTSLQIRNVMTGFLFLLYVSCIFLIAVPIALAFYLCCRVVFWPTLRLPRKVLVCLLIAFSVTSLVGGLLVFLGFVVGYLYPWGQDWQTPFSQSMWTLQAQKEGLITGYVQFSDAFLHPKITVGSISLAIALFYPIAELFRRIDLLQEHQDSQDKAVSKIMLEAFAKAFIHPVSSLIYLITALSIVLVGFAQDVYPNMKYNLGGGQPEVAILQIGTEKSAGLALPGIATCCESGQTDSVVATDPVVIWYRSDKFLYIVPLSKSEQAAARLIALDIAMVRAIQYLPVAVRVGSGGQILGAHPY